MCGSCKATEAATTTITILISLLIMHVVVRLCFVNISAPTFHCCVINTSSDVVVTRYAAHISVTHRRSHRTMWVLSKLVTGWG